MRKIISISVEPEDEVLIRLSAKKYDKTISEYIRYILRKDWYEMKDKNENRWYKWIIIKEQTEN